MKRWICLLLLAAIALGLAACGAEKPEQTPPSDTQDTTPTVYNPMTAMEAMEEMKIGICWGNTFDAPDGELSWGQPMTTREMFLKVHALGFNTIRIPISWGKHTSGAPDYTIDEAWLKRVKMVVDYALEDGMYVIINSHHDNDIYMPRAENQEQAVAYLSAIWTQVASYFEYADHHLIFQTMNEPRVTGTAYEWSVNTRNKDCMAAVEVVNVLNQTALDAIRATGGRNADRFVIVSPYAGNSGAAQLPVFRLPEDSAQNKLIVSVHAYTPYNLCLNTKSPDSQFLVSHEKELITMMKNLHFKYVSNGIPVIIDEMGCINKDNPEDRYNWAKTYVSLAKSYGMVCCWWDNGSVSGSGENFGLFNRRKLVVYDQSQTVYQGLMEGLEVSE